MILSLVIMFDFLPNLTFLKSFKRSREDKEEYKIETYVDEDDADEEEEEKRHQSPHHPGSDGAEVLRGEGAPLGPAAGESG